MDDVIVVGDADDGLGARLDAEIHAWNVAVTGLTNGRLLRISLRGADGDLVAGLSGWTWGGCGYVEFLWVRADRRGRGIGGLLLAAAEEEACRRGCVQVVLSTHTFQAPDFYARRGYVECGRTPGYPAGHAQVHMVKPLAAAAAAGDQ